MTRFMWCSTSSTVSSKSSRIFWMNVAELGDLLVVQAAGGLVEQEQPRLRDERACELDALLDPVRQRRRREQRAIAEPDDVEHLERLRLPHLPPAAVRADEHVLEHGHRPEELDVLERARDRPCARSCTRAALRIDEPSSSTSPESGL